MIRSLFAQRTTFSLLSPVCCQFSTWWCSLFAWEDKNKPPWINHCLSLLEEKGASTMYWRVTHDTREDASVGLYMAPSHRRVWCCCLSEEKRRGESLVMEGVTGVLAYRHEPPIYLQYVITHYPNTHTHVVPIISEPPISSKRVNQCPAFAVNTLSLPIPRSLSQLKEWVLERPAAFQWEEKGSCLHHEMGWLGTCTHLYPTQTYMFSWNHVPFLVVRHAYFSWDC